MGYLQRESERSIGYVVFVLFILWGEYVYAGTLLDYGDVYIVPLYTPLHISEDSLLSPMRSKARELA
jgi:hypothetical protein